MKKILASLLTVAIIASSAASLVYADDAAVTTAAPTDSDSQEFVTTGEIYSDLALFIAYVATSGNAFEQASADPLAYASKTGLLTESDKTRYRLETGKEFDFDAPITRQDYAIAVERMMRVFKKFGIELVQNTAEQSRDSMVQNNGIGRIESFSPSTSALGIGVMPYEDKSNVGFGGVRDVRGSSVFNNGSSSANDDRTGQGADTFTDGAEIRGSAREAVALAVTLRILEPKSFAEKQVFFVEDPRAEVKLTAEEFEAKNADARSRYEARMKLLNQQVILDKGVFIAPNDLVTLEEYENFEAALEGLKFSNFTLSIE